MMPLCRKDMIMTHRKLHYITDVVTTHTQYHKANVHSRKSLSDCFYIVTTVADPWLSASIFGTKNRIHPTHDKVKKWSKYFHIDASLRHTRTARSYSPGCANVHCAPYTVHPNQHPHHTLLSRFEYIDLVHARACPRSATSPP